MNYQYLTGFLLGCPEAGLSGNRSGRLFEVLIESTAPCILTKFDLFKRNWISTSTVFPLFRPSSPIEDPSSDTYTTFFRLTPGKISTSCTLGLSPSDWSARVIRTLEQDDKISWPPSVSSFKTSWRAISPNSLPSRANFMPNDWSKSVLLTDNGQRTLNLKIYNACVIFSVSRMTFPPWSGCLQCATDHTENSRATDQMSVPAHWHSVSCRCWCRRPWKTPKVIGIGAYR